MIVVSLAIWVVYTKLNIRIDADDALRLQQVRDLLAGQSWFDLTQHRLGFGEGTVLSLSRLVDAPIAGLILLFGVFLDPGEAEKLVLLVWPFLNFAVVVACVYTLCHRLAGAKAAVYGTTLAAIVLVQTKAFDPGSLHHFNAELALFSLAIIGFVMRRPLNVFAALGGVSVALSIAIGPEMATQSVVIFMAFAVVWMLRGQAERRSTQYFALTCFATLCLSFVVTSPQQSFFSKSGELFPIEFAIPALLASAGLLILTHALAGFERRRRVAGVAGLVAAVMASAWLFDPVYLADVRLIVNALWTEGWAGLLERTIAHGASSHHDGGRFLGCLTACFVGLLISIWFAMRDVRRDPWTLLSMLLAVSLVTTVCYGEAHPSVVMLSVLPTSILGARLIERKNPNTNIWYNLAAIALLMISIPAITGTATAMRAAAAEARKAGAGHLTQRRTPTGRECADDAGLNALRKLETGMVLTGAELGPQILMHTPHRVVIGKDALAEIAGSPVSARAAYLVDCRNRQGAETEAGGFASSAENGALAGRLSAVPIKGSSALSIYRVVNSSP